GFDVENADPNYSARAARIDFADVDDLLVVGRPIDDPAAGRCDGGDAGAGAGLGLWLAAGRRSGNPYSTLARVGQMTGRDAEGRGGARADVRVGRRRVQDDGPGGMGAGTGNQEPDDCECERAAAHGPSSKVVGPNVVFGVMSSVGAPVQ